ncbi:hypothetical protein [Verrucomicrobium spinosum]|uniref:hypothetical protein n=1 Tax=Verrucomicrobium spinosum TaxID=2736 RepID=UPI00017452EF|nr:hypothetical protein [Verrucomicrobium spinosum]
MNSTEAYQLVLALAEAELAQARASKDRQRYPAREIRRGEAAVKRFRRYVDRLTARTLRESRKMKGQTLHRPKCLMP